MKESANVALLFYENFGRFRLNRRYIGDNFLMQLIDILHSIPVVCIEYTFGLYLVLELLDDFSVLNLPFYESLLYDSDLVL